MARQTLVVIYGGTQLTPPQAQMVATLAREIVEHTDYVLVTGGFKVFKNTPHAVSTDWMAASTAHDILKQQGVIVDSRLQTWLPDPELDRRMDDVQRFELGSVRRLEGQSDRQRRFGIARDADLIVTASGSGNTGMLLDAAEVMHTPALPLPFTGSDSLEFWQRNRDAIGKRFGMAPASVDRLESFNLETSSPSEQQGLAQQIVQTILPQALRRRCLVLMPFRPELTSFYEGLMKPAIERAGFEVIRIDFSVEPGDIYQQFVGHLERSDAFVVDVTGGNPNVMYELGHAHARRITPLLIHRGSLDDAATDRLPFYLLHQKVQNVDPLSPAERERFEQRIGEYLTAVKTHARWS